MALVGALTAVPLTLLLPALFFLRARPARGLCSRVQPALAAAVAAAGAVVTVLGTAGAVADVAEGWRQSGHPPFADC